MKKLTLPLIAGLLLQISYASAQGYDIKLSIPQMANKNVILANYLDGKVYAVDTAQIDASGKGSFTKTNKKLPRGMYILLFSSSNYFDMIIGDNQHFSVQTDTVNILESIRFQNSPENQAFLDFQKFMTSQNKKTSQLNDELAQSPQKDDPEVRKKYIERYNETDREVRNYIANICKQYPGTAFATFANFTLSPDIPDFSKEVPEGTKDRNLEIQRKAYYYEFS